MRGLTGGIASGKSTVAQMLAVKGAVVLDADLIAREVISPNTTGFRHVATTFPEVILENDKIDRKRLGSIIFQDSTKRRSLEAIIHPLVIERIQQRGAELEAQGKIVFADIPLLFETQCQHWLESIWVVYVHASAQLERLMKRDSLNAAAALARIESQLSLETKKSLADVVIDNNGTMSQTQRQVDQHCRALHAGKLL